MGGDQIPFHRPGPTTPAGARQGLHHLLALTDRDQFPFLFHMAWLSPPAWAFGLWLGGQVSLIVKRTGNASDEASNQMFR